MTDIAKQHIAGSKLKITDSLSRNRVGGATPEDKSDKKDVINILSEQAKQNLKNGQLFADQSKDGKRAPKKHGTSEEQSEKRENQSQLNRREQKIHSEKITGSLKVALQIQVVHQNRFQKFF